MLDAIISHWRVLPMRGQGRKNNNYLNFLQ